MSTNPAMDRHDRHMAFIRFWERAGKIILVLLIIGLASNGLDMLGAWPRG